MGIVKPDKIETTPAKKPHRKKRYSFCGFDIHEMRTHQVVVIAAIL
jgi:hypothetical protein